MTGRRRGWMSSGLQTTGYAPLGYCDIIADNIATYLLYQNVGSERIGRMCLVSVELKRAYEFQ